MKTSAILTNVKVGDEVIFTHSVPTRRDKVRVIAETVDTLTIDNGRVFSRNTGFALGGAVVYISAIVNDVEESDESWEASKAILENQLARTNEELRLTQMYNDQLVGRINMIEQKNFTAAQKEKSAVDLLQEEIDKLKALGDELMNMRYEDVKKG